MGTLFLFSTKEHYMLSLFPTEYWVGIAVASAGRFFAAQIISYKITQFNRKSQYKQLVNTVGSFQYKLFTRLNGLAGLLLALGFLSMFYIAYNYIVPVTQHSRDALYVVTILGYGLLGIEILITLLSCVVAAIVMFKKY